MVENLPIAPDQKVEINKLIEFISLLMREGGSLSPNEYNDLRVARSFLRMRSTITPKIAQKILSYAQIFEDRGIIHWDQDYIDDIKRTASSVIALPFESFEKEIIKRIKENSAKSEKLKVVFMFGSGASRPAPSNIPTVGEMLDYIVEKLPPTEIPFANKVRNWSRREDVNIEDILTAGYLGTLLVSRPVVSELVGEIIYRESKVQVQPEELREREYVFSFQELVNRVFSMVSGMMATADSNGIHESVARMIKSSEEDNSLGFSVVTTNYDVCIEKAFEKIGLKYCYLGVAEEKGVPLVKIHGSINWFYCEGCQSVITYSIDELSAFKKIFPTSGSCNKCGTPSSLLMVPPIAYKYVMYPLLIDIWQAAMETIESADLIIAIGYSFSLADDYILKMIIGGLKKKGSILALLNTDAKVADDLQSKLSAYHLRLAFPFIGDALEVTPKLIDSIQGARAKACEQKTHEADAKKISQKKERKRKIQK